MSTYSLTPTPIGIGVQIVIFDIPAPFGKDTFSIGIIDFTRKDVDAKESTSIMLTSPDNLVIHGNKPVHHEKLDQPMWDLPSRLVEKYGGVFTQYQLHLQSGEDVWVDFLIKLDQLHPSSITIPSSFMDIGGGTMWPLPGFELKIQVIGVITGGRNGATYPVGSIIAVEGKETSNDSSAPGIYLVAAPTYDSWRWSSNFGDPPTIFDPKLLDSPWKISSSQTIIDEPYGCYIGNTFRAPTDAEVPEWIDGPFSDNDNRMLPLIAYWGTYHGDPTYFHTRGNQRILRSPVRLETVPGLRKTYEFPDGFWTSSMPVPASDDSDLNQALASAIDGIQTVQANGLMFIRETTSLVKFLTTFGKSLGSARGRDTLLKKMKKGNLTPLEVKGANAYLQWHYGVRLSVRDWKDYLQYLKNTASGKSENPLRSRGKCGDYHVAVYFDYEDSKDNLTKLNRLLFDLDLEPTISNLWDAVPYSFVVDWFAGLSNLFEDTERYARLGYPTNIFAGPNVITLESAGIKVRSVMISRKRTYQLDGAFLGSTKTEYTRWVFPEIPFVPSTFNLKDMGLEGPKQHITELLALVLQRKQTRK